MTEQHKKLAYEIAAGLILVALLVYILHHVFRAKEISAAHPPPPPKTVGELAAEDIEAANQLGGSTETESAMDGYTNVSTGATAAKNAADTRAVRVAQRQRAAAVRRANKLAAEAKKK